jgi:hypothetical protein
MAILDAKGARRPGDGPPRDATGLEPVGNAPAEFTAQFHADIARFAKVIEQAKIPKMD